MPFTHQISNQILLITLSGDLIGENQSELLETVSNKLSEVNQCAVDLSAVRYMNSSGLGVLITLLTKFRNKNGELVLINPSEQIKKLLMITKLNSIFSVVDNEAQAIEKLKNI